MKKLKIEEILKNKREISPTFCVLPWTQSILDPTSCIKLCGFSEKPTKDEKGKIYTHERGFLGVLLEY